MGKFLLILLTVFCLTVEAGFAEEKKQLDKKQKLSSAEDQEILKLIETLKLLDLVENISLLQDLDILIGEESNEKND